MPRRRLRELLQLGATLLVLGGIAFFMGPVLTRWQQRALPAGWTLLRPPQETSALVLRDNIVWAGGVAGVTPIDWRKRKVVARETPVFRSVRDLMVDRDGFLWVAHSAGVARCSEGPADEFTDAPGLPPGPSLSLIQRRDGEILAGGEQGLFRWTGASFEEVQTTEFLGMGSIDVLFEDSRGDLWLGSMEPSSGGLWRLHDGQWENWTDRGIAHHSVTEVHEEPDGSLWFGTGFGRRGGLSIWSGSEWKQLTKADGLAGEKVRSIYRDRLGRHWVGSEYDGIAVSDGSGWRILSPVEGLAGWEVKDMLEDPDGNLWLGTEDGVSRLPAALSLTVR